MSNISNMPRRALFASTAFAALIAASSAYAAGANAQITGDGFSPAVIKVISDNGSSWTKIEERPLGLPVKIHIGMDGYKVATYDVRQPGLPAGGLPMLSGAPFTNEVNISQTLIGKTDFMTAAERQSVIDMCNAKLSQGGNIHQDYNLFTGVKVVLTASFAEKGLGQPLNDGGLGSPHVSNGSVTVPVLCQAAKERPKTPGDVVAEAPDFKVKGIHLRFITTATYVTQPNPGTKCKLTHAKVRVETTKAGPVKFKLWTKVGNDGIKSEVIEAWSKFVGPGKFEASFQKAIPVSQTTNVQAKAEDMVNAIGLTTDWKDVNVNCTGAGGGGLTNVPNTSNPDNARSASKPEIKVAPGRITTRDADKRELPKREIQKSDNQKADAQPGRHLKRLRVVDEDARAKDRFERTKIHVR